MDRLFFKKIKVPSGSQAEMQFATKPFKSCDLKGFSFALIADFGNYFQKLGVKLGVSKFFEKKGHLIF